MYTTLATLTAALAATASAFDCSGPYFSFYNRGGGAMSYQRLDPAVSPGKQSSHLHSFDGGNALAATMGFDTTQESSCTTARIIPDKSLYWRPTLFWNGNGTGFYRVPDNGLKIYYKFGDGNDRANVTEFPEGFRMMAGNPNKRADGANPGGIRWACHGPNIFTNGFPTGFNSCPNGFASEVTMPACWNGKDFDPANPYAHMAYPSNAGKGLDVCPSTHKVARFPTIFIEFWYDIKMFDGQYSTTDNPWVLSNGDPTGFGFHADFLNGWEKGVLAKATGPTDYCNCGCGCGTDQMKTCFGAENVNEDDDAAFKTCSATPVFPEDTTKVDKLPGCNPIQSGPEDATPQTGAGCNAAAPAASAVSSVASVAASAVSSAAAGVSSVAAVVSSIAADANSAVTSATAITSYGAISSKASTRTRRVRSSVLPSLSISLPNKQPIKSEGGGYGFATPTTPTASSATAAHNPPKGPGASSGGPLGPHVTDEATNPAATGLASLSDSECAAKVTITITPTVYVTAGDVSTSCGSTVYTTVTNVATVTVPAPGGYKHKRHADLHKQ